MNKEVSYTTHINENKGNRVEFWITNFDYADGSEYIAKLFCEEYGMQMGDKLEGIYFSIIRIYSNTEIYEVLWDEDIGNSVYSIKEDEASINELERRLNYILEKLNKKRCRLCIRSKEISI